MLVLTLAFVPIRSRLVGGTRKITVEIADELLDRALEATGKGVTETVRRGLTLVAAGAAYDDLRKLRGKVRIGIDLATLREDR
jgi:hypothetical protein